MDYVALGMRAGVVLAIVVAILVIALLERTLQAGDRTGERGDGVRETGTTDGGSTAAPDAWIGRGATIDPTAPKVTAALRRRFVLGVPWGSLTTAAFVIGVYLFVQGGYGHWYDPVVLPFRAWSYFSPVGVLVAGFAHVGPGHLLSNVFGTLAIAPIVEYAVGHFPDRRGASAFGSLTDNPYVRAFVLFPGAAIGVGLVSSLFGLGPIVGFSGVVFAFAGAALVYRPLTTVVALSATSVLRLTYRALVDPTTVASSHPAYVTPWWADIAVQGHALGLLVGVLAASALAAHRDDDLPRPRRLFVGALLFAVPQGLWAVYWFRGGETYVLYRAVGLALTVVLATLVASLGAGGRWGTFRTGSIRESLDTLTPRNGAVVALLLATAMLAGPAVPINLYTVGGEPLPGDPVSVRAYNVTYAESVESGMVSVIEIEALGETTSVNTSGVLVRNPRREIWTTAVSSGRLAFTGTSRVVVGGLGWRDTVTAVRRGWHATGGDTAYRVTLWHDETRQVAYLSEPARAGPRIDGWNVSIAPTDRTFLLVVTRGNETASVPIPARNQTVAAGGLRFVREGKAVYALAHGNETRVKVAKKETYQ